MDPHAIIEKLLKKSFQEERKAKEHDKNLKPIQCTRHYGVAYGFDEAAVTVAEMFGIRITPEYRKTVRSELKASQTDHQKVN